MSYSVGKRPTENNFAGAGRPPCLTVRSPSPKSGRIEHRRNTLIGASPSDAEAALGQTTAKPHDVPFADALRVWLRVAALSFGGPAGQIAVMHRIVVDEKRWIGEARFLHALSLLHAAARARRRSSSRPTSAG